MLCTDTVSFNFGPMIERECTSKRRYESEAQAEAEARRIFMEGGPDLRCYTCPWCFGVHLSSRPERSI